MEDPRFLRVILFGLILAALTIGYLIFSGRFLKPQTAKTQTITQTQTPSPTSVPTQVVVNNSGVVSIPSPFLSPVPSPRLAPVASAIPATSGKETAYTRIVDRSRGQVTTLPKTGVPTILIGIASLSAIISGWFLRKYPE